MRRRADVTRSWRAKGRAAHDRGHITTDPFGVSAFECGCGYRVEAMTFDAAQFLALAHGTRTVTSNKRLK